MNGRLDLFLFSIVGGHAIMCLEALKEIGAQDSYRILKAACDLFPGGQPSQDHELRRMQMRIIKNGAMSIDDLIDDVTAVELHLEPNLFPLLLDYYHNASHTDR